MVRAIYKTPKWVVLACFKGYLGSPMMSFVQELHNGTILVWQLETEKLPNGRSIRNFSKQKIKVICMRQWSRALASEQAFGCLMDFSYTHR